MSPEEARWFGSALSHYSVDELSPLINLGSSSAAYRQTACSEIEQCIFEPLRKRGVTVYHSDMKNESGVDIVGDILDSRTQDGIRSLRARSILCTNILEHVANREGFCRVCEDLLPAAGLLLVSVPYRYPYHPDPIDTLFRPDLGQLKRLWRDLDFVEGKIVSFGNYFRAMRRKKWLIARDAYLVFAGVAKIDRWRVLVGNYRFLFSRYEASCAVFRKR